MANPLRQEQLEVTSRLDLVSQVQHWFHGVCSSLDEDFAWIRPYSDRLELALTEGFTNAVRHAHAHLPADTVIQIDLALALDQVEIRIWDQGHAFDPQLLPEPQPGELLDSGYGWFLLRRLADQVTYKRHRDGRNCLSIIQHGTCSAG
ncbi:MAG TPA: ATP-binding protein [Leptolyngbyaceae cyanobacterium M65_K2018_010]|nr:ATP-binding protein [Leptolyngbyaceae cyanobacterium M65_K2018_010]